MRLKELREFRELTQQEVAKAVNTSRTNIGRWEKGENEPSASSLAALADFFEVSTDYLLGREDDFGGAHFPTPAAELTQEEKRLLEVFRKLNTKNRMHALAYAEVRLEEQAARA